MKTLSSKMVLIMHLRLTTMSTLMRLMTLYQVKMMVSMKDNMRNLATQEDESLVATSKEQARL